MSRPTPRLQLFSMALAVVLLALLPACARASLSVLVGEPFGHWGAVMPLGHTALYLDNVCADGPLRLRPCVGDEPRGVVLARYHAIGRYDWLASPVREFLWATNDPAEIPAFATPEKIWALRQRFREQFLRSVVPDGTEGQEAGDGRAAGAGSLEEWWESAGMAYNRRVFAYQVRTTPEQDAKLIAYLNATPNRHLYHLKKTNCADFVAELVNVLFPHAVHNDRIADFGLMTPKEVARSLQAYARMHPDLELRVWQIPQVPGSLVRSRRIRGGAESGLKTKRYLLPLLVLQPEVPAYLATIYLWHGRWWVGTDATALTLNTLPPAEPRPLTPPLSLAHTDEPSPAPPSFSGTDFDSAEAGAQPHLPSQAVSGDPASFR